MLLDFQCNKWSALRYLRELVMVGSLLFKIFRSISPLRAERNKKKEFTWQDIRSRAPGLYITLSQKSCDARLLRYKLSETPPLSAFFHKDIFNTLVALILAYFVLFPMQLQFNAYVLKFRFYSVFASHVYEFVMSLHYLFLF